MFAELHRAIPWRPGWRAVMLLAAMAALGGCGKREEQPAAAGAPAVKPRDARIAELQQRAPTNAQEMALQRASDAAYREQLTKLATERNAKAQAVAAARAGMEKIEAAHTNAPAVERLRQEIEELRRAIAEKETALAAAAPYRQDPAWQKFEAEARQAQQEADAAQAEVQRAISERMRAQYDAMRRERTATAGTRPVLPVLPVPEKPVENTNRLHRLTPDVLGAPKLVVPPRPGQRGLAATNMAPARTMAPPVTVIPGQAN